MLSVTMMNNADRVARSTERRAWRRAVPPSPNINRKMSTISSMANGVKQTDEIVGNAKGCGSG